jgi:hypothetical protein
MEVVQHGEMWDIVFMNGETPITLNTEEAIFTW